MPVRAPTVLLADDLTGALDCAAAFAGRGVSSFASVGRDIAGPPRAGVMSVNLDTRRLPAREAAADPDGVFRGFMPRPH